MKTNNILTILNEFDYISFDIFDTLVKRDVYQPKDVFIFVEKEFETKYRRKIDFVRNRITAETIARKNIQFEDITINEIYSFLYKFNDNDKKLLMQLELEIEKKLIVPNKKMYEIYDYCLRNSKKIIITTDMYLDEKLLKGILEQTGFSIYEKIYISSNLRLSKATGHIWDHILKDLSIKPTDLIHLGDSLKHDYILPKLKGINSILIPSDKPIFIKNNKNVNLSPEEKWASRILESFIQNHAMSNCSDEYYDIGFKYFGQFILGFSNWLMDEVKKKNIDNIFFFSRDGYVLKKAFDMINKDPEIKSHYLYVSRRSLIVPTLWTFEDDYKSLMKCVLYNRYFSMENLLYNLGLEAHLYQDIVSNFGYSLNYVFERTKIFEDKKIKQLFFEIKEDIVKNSKKEYELLIEYLNENNFNGQVAVVDIGWKGSMQQAIFTIAKKAKLNLIMHGYYTGLRKTALKNVEQGMISSGYVFDFTTQDIIHPFCGLFEFFFLAQHGSVKKYKKDNGTIIPELLPYEYSIDENVLNKEALCSKQVHDGALAMVSEYADSLLFKNLNLTKNIAFIKMFLLGTNPTNKSLRMFGDFSFYDVKFMKMAVPKKKVYYLRNPKQLMLDFANSTWRIGFMKRFLKVNIPYYSLYQVFQRRIVE